LTASDQPIKFLDLGLLRLTKNLTLKSPNLWIP
jgi:hypothetical protein